MVATRASTQSLPQKQPSFAELQATWTNDPKLKTRTKDSAPPKRLKKRSAPGPDTSTLEAQRTAAAASKSRSTSKDNVAARKPSKQIVARRKTAKVDASPQHLPAPRTQMAATDPHHFNYGAQTTFLSLPPEIRNEIYSLALVNDKPLRARTVHPYLLEPGLLATNRQVRSEAIGIWYGENVFEIDGSSPAVKFLRASSDNKLRALCCLRILTTMVPAEDYIKTRIEQLLREFQPRGLGRQVIHFMMSVPDGFEWVNLASLKRTAKASKDRDR